MICRRNNHLWCSVANDRFFKHKRIQSLNHFPKLLFSTSPESSNVKKPQLVIIGTGWAGYKALVEAKKMFKKSKDSHEIVVISERNVSIYIYPIIRQFLL